MRNRAMVDNAAGETIAANDRLHGWKEIAVFLGHGVRTVQRWELERELPVHRTPGGKTGSVYALKRELTQWMTSAVRSAEETHSAIDDPGSAPGAEATPISQPVEAFAQAVSREVEEASIAIEMPGALLSARMEGRGNLWWKAGLAAAGLAALLALPILRLVQGHAAVFAHQAHVPDPVAADLYLRGRYYWEKRDKADLERAVDLYTQAIVRDPSYAQAFAGLADCYNLLSQFSTMPPEEAYPRAIAAASRAIQLDPDLAEAHASLAFGTFYWTWDEEGADREFQTAIRLNPNLAVAHHWYANTLMSRRRDAEAMQEIEIAQRLDPTSTAILASKGIILLADGQRDEGIALLRQLENAQPDFLPPRSYLAGQYFADGDGARFLEEEKGVAARLQDPAAIRMMDVASSGFAAGGNQGMLRAMLAEQKKRVNTGKGSHLFLAELDCLLGEHVDALQELRLAYQRHEVGVYGLSQDRCFKGLRDDMEFQQMEALKWHGPLSEPAAGGDNPALASATSLPRPSAR